MRVMRAMQLFFAASALSGVLAACGSSDSSNVAGNGKGGATGSAASGPDLGSVGASSNSGGSSASGDPVDTCAGELVEAKRIPSTCT